jgi:restriction system protein
MMAKKRKNNLLEDMLDLVSLLPWWAGIAIAVVGYLTLRHMAVPVQVKANQPDQLSHVMVQSMISGMATVGQYVVVLIGFGGAAISLFRRKQRASLLTDVAQSQSVNVLDGISWQEFELLVGEAYRMQGYHVLETGGGGADGGVDLILSKGGEKFFVQCKQWKAYRVGVDVVRELFGVMAAKGATGGFVVTSGRFSDDAQAFAQGRNVQLVDGPKLFNMVKAARRSLNPIAQQAGGKTTCVNEPVCPQCGSSMVKNVPRKGSNAGKEFWGCPRFPMCRSVRKID